MKNSNHNGKNWTRTALAGVAALGFATSANAAIVDGLVEYWALDGDYSATVDPSHVGTLTTPGLGNGSAAFVSGKFGSAIDLANAAGADNQAFITIGGDENNFDFAGGSMTISAWYTTESLYTNWQTLVGKGEGNGWRVARTSSSATTFTFSGRVPQEVDAELDQQDGSWHHMVTTVESGGANNMYINGVLAGTTAMGPALENRSNPMQIGGNPDAAGRGWNGNIDDVAVWDRALSQAEVESIWAGGAGASVGSLIPEPSSVTLLGLAGLALAFRKRR